MLERLFGNENVERIVFYLIQHETCYAKQLATNFSVSLSHIQRTLKKLEYAGVLVSFEVGRTRIFQFNPRYPMLNEFKAFFSKSYSFFPDKIKQQYYEFPTRKRPRRSGKIL